MLARLIIMRLIASEIVSKHVSASHELTKPLRRYAACWRESWNEARLWASRESTYAFPCISPLFPWSMGHAAWLSIKVHRMYKFIGTNVSNSNYLWEWCLMCHRICPVHWFTVNYKRISCNSGHIAQHYPYLTNIIINYRLFRPFLCVSQKQQEIWV